MKSSIKVALLASALVGVFGINSAQAACVQTCSGTASYTDNTGYWFYCAPVDTLYSPYYYYFRTTDPELTHTLQNALASSQTVQISGNSTTCPSSGVSRYGGIVNYHYTYAK